MQTWIGRTCEEVSLNCQNVGPDADMQAKQARMAPSRYGFRGGRKPGKQENPGDRDVAGRSGFKDSGNVERIQ